MGCSNRMRTGPALAPTSAWISEICDTREVGHVCTAVKSLRVGAEPSGVPRGSVLEAWWMLPSSEALSGQLRRVRRGLREARRAWAAAPLICRE